ncbi:beta-lactamase [Trinickia caryophylli]|nr:beta-lactamase [Trinickia caryophylli]
MAYALSACAARTGAGTAQARAGAADAAQALAALERISGGRLGLCAIDTARGATLGYRASERFPFCSTFKLMLAATVLARSVEEPALLEHRIRYARTDLVNYSPETGKHVDDGMTVSELCRVTVQWSDNTAANLLIDLLGGSQAVTAYARGIGDREFRLDRRETTLNTAIPGDLRDTTTPAAMAQSTRSLVLGSALPAPQQARLRDWLLGCKTGDRRIRAAVPAGWQVGDKTGTGDYGTANDVGVLWPPAEKPLVLAIYHTHTDSAAKARDDVIASAARIAIEALTR